MLRRIVRQRYRSEIDTTKSFALIMHFWCLLLLHSRHQGRRCCYMQMTCKSNVCLDEHWFHAGQSFEVGGATWFKNIAKGQYVYLPRFFFIPTVQSSISACEVESNDDHWVVFLLSLKCVCCAGRAFCYWAFTLPWLL